MKILSRYLTEKNQKELQLR